METLLRVIALRHLGRERLRFLLTVLGIALGVGVLVAIRTTNVTILKSFRSTLEVLSGKADLEIRAGENGMDENLFLMARAISGVLATAPVVEVHAGLLDLPGETLLVLGIDPLSDDTFRSYPVAGKTVRAAGMRLLTEPDAVLVSRELAARLKLREGDRINLVVDDRLIRLTIRGILETVGPGSAFAGKLAVMDIAAAQWTFGRIGRLDRIDLRITPGFREEDVIRVLRDRVPANVAVQRPERRSEQAGRMLAAFQLNLTALSGIALFVGAFLIYNTVGIGVVRRRKEIGILRSLGASRRQVLILFEADALVLGVSGSLLGVGLGLLMARALMGTVTRAVTANYLLVAVSGIAVRGEILAEGILLGIGVSVLGSLLPVLEASRIPPREALQAQSVEVRRAAGLRRTAGLGTASLVLAAGAALLPPVAGFPLFGFLSAFLLLSGFALLSPLSVRMAGSLLPRIPFVRSSPSRRIAAETIGLTPGRSSVTVSAIMIGMALLVSIGIMIGSFRRTVAVWVDQTMTADLLVVSRAGLFHGADATIPEDLKRIAEEVPGVAAVNAVRLTHVMVGGDPIVLGAGDLAVHRRYGRFLPVRGDSDAMILKALSSGGVIVSEGLARRRALVQGDNLVLDTPRGAQPFPIAGIVYDYASDRGKIFMDRRLYARLWNDNRLTVVDIYRTPNVSLEVLQRNLKASFSGERTLDVITHEDLKNGVLEIFDQTFAVTSALEGIAVIVAVLGIATTLLAAILERRREIGTLRALGASRSQIGRLFLFEAGYLGLLGTALGAAAGLALSVILIYVINRQSFHWTIQYVLDYGALFQAFGMILVASLAAGLLPARRAARLPVAEALHWE